MKNLKLTFDKIVKNTSEIVDEDIKQILLLYEEKIVFIGDCCVRFDKFRYFRSFLNNATITLNFAHKENFKFYDGLLKNNPHVDHITTLDWAEIGFEKYDIVFCISYREEKFLEFLYGKYGDLIMNGQFKLAVYSISELILKSELRGNYIFPVNKHLIEHVKKPRPGELYISKEEQRWADHWLESKGLKKNEDLYIILDSTSIREKLMKITVYFDFLTTILKGKNVKALIFDEGSIGKEEFYRQWLDNKTLEKLIFSKSVSLRENLCFIGSSNTRLIFGPCTGLMHCSSSIYNNYLSNGMDIRDIPLMITYTGQYTIENKNANFWWGSAPLVNCLLLKKRHNRKEIVLLSSLPEQEKDLDDSLACSEYTTEMLMGFINRKVSQNSPDLLYPDAFSVK